MFVFWGQWSSIVMYFCIFVFLFSYLHILVFAFLYFQVSSQAVRPVCGQPTGLYFCILYLHKLVFLYFGVSGIVGSLRLSGGLFGHWPHLSSLTVPLKPFLKLSDQFGHWTHCYNYALKSDHLTPSQVIPAVKLLYHREMFEASHWQPACVCVCGQNGRLLGASMRR